MDPDERALLTADIRRYTELLSGTFNADERAGLELLISRLEARLAAMGPTPPAEASSVPTMRR